MTEPANLETILRIGQIVGNQYRVDGFIAQGGMAAVWAGVNQHTGKRVALKVMLRSFSTHIEGRLFMMATASRAMNTDADRVQ